MLALLVPLPAALNLPDAPHSSAEWKIAAYSSAAPAAIAAGATIYDNDAKTVLRVGTNAWSCLAGNPKGPDADGAFSSAHAAMPICFDAEGFKWITGWMSNTAPVMEHDAYLWMLHGDVGEDNTTPLVMSFEEIEDPDNWIESGPHLMMMPKDPASLDSFPTDFSTGAPFVMFQGGMFAHVMIPLNPSGSDGWTETALPEELAHNEPAWKVAAFSSAAPAKIGAHATVMDTDGATVLRAGTNGWTCLSANMHPEPAEGWPTAHNAEPLCLDAVGFQWIAGYMAGTPPVMDRDSFVFMLHGDNGYDNTNPAVHAQADSAPGKWIESGPHLMLMPKDPASLDAFTDDFHSGDASPFVMFRGSPFSHLMIPMPGFYDYGAGASTGAAIVAPRITAEPTAKAAAAHGAGSLIVGTLGVALVAALAVVKSRFGTNAEAPTAPVLV